MLIWLKAPLIIPLIKLSKLIIFIQKAKGVDFNSCDVKVLASDHCNSGADHPVVQFSSTFDGLNLLKHLAQNSGEVENERRS